ncbi:hypothetical protein NVIE_016990 [Nitrososphaera viennensis EN76]|uniref:Uncharacterized protein n=1 Tax=Nitrososphaera viennensis EN76 TaxID=926571 RepID=A0A060HR28_9ARCH|nr:hypothetical protein NVIE_016990 [Nitrososphaera viennensis EN76]
MHFFAVDTPRTREEEYDDVSLAGSCLGPAKQPYTNNARGLARKNCEQSKKERGRFDAAEIFSKYRDSGTNFEKLGTILDKRCRDDCNLGEMGHHQLDLPL